ncbi:hypothetical protein RZ64_02065 [[Haemophilus] ducreyi]|nr:hypothetical protein RZ64_02065 [[Haemophilus] ducreyi]
MLLVLDPPYLCARQESYKQAHYFDLIDFLLRFIHLVEPPYIFSAQQKASLSALLIISLRAKPITGKHLQIASVSQFKRRQAITVSMKIRIICILFGINVMQNVLIIYAKKIARLQI